MATPDLSILLVIAAVAFGLIFFFVLLVALLWGLRKRSRNAPAARMRPCPDCRNLCSLRAAACPKCGCPLESTTER